MQTSACMAGGVATTTTSGPVASSCSSGLSNVATPVSVPRTLAAARTRRNRPPAARPRAPRPRAGGTDVRLVEADKSESHQRRPFVSVGADLSIGAGTPTARRQQAGAAGSWAVRISTRWARHHGRSPALSPRRRPRVRKIAGEEPRARAVADQERRVACGGRGGHEQQPSVLGDVVGRAEGPDRLTVEVDQRRLETVGPPLGQVAAQPSAYTRRLFPSAGAQSRGRE